MNAFLRASTLVAVALLSPCIGRGGGLRSLAGADFVPGKLRLLLGVAERSGVVRKGVVVTGGVPFPPGFLPDADRLDVVDEAGRRVPSQAVPLVCWHPPAYDGSVQWALVSFSVNVPARRMSRYYLVDNARQSPSASSLRLQKDRESLTVHSGQARFVVPRSGNAILSEAWIGDRQVIGRNGLLALLTAGDWPERTLAEGSQHSAYHDRVEVEEAGPVRIVLALRGPFRPGDKQGKLYDHTARLYFTAGSTSVRIVSTISNGKLDPTLYDGARRVFIWPIEDASLVADLTLNGSAEVTTLGEGKKVTLGDGRELSVYQDSSGGEKWKDLGGGNYERWLAKYTQGKVVRGVRFRGYRVTAGEDRLAEGNRHLGAIDVADESAGLSAALRNFRADYPSALTASAQRLRVGLFPGEFAEPFALRPGQRKSWEVCLTLRTGGEAELPARAAELDRRLLFRPDPAWMVRCANAGAWPAGMALLPRPRLPTRWDKAKLDGIHTGWDWYGWISGWNAGGGHWNQRTCFTPWVLWADGANFDRAESRASWAADLCSIHYDRPDLATFWLMLRDWDWRENRVKVETHPDYYNRDTWGRPDSGHMGMFMWTEAYFLTGDGRYREAIEHLGDRARAVLWAYTHDDKADGTGPLPRAVNWCHKRDPDADPDFKLDTRYAGWPLYDLATCYRVTGRPELLAEARTVARAFRNTARYSPVGFMVTKINAKGDPSVYGRQGPFDKGRAESASQCYAHFQQGIMATGLLEYYRMSHDVEALDALIGFADCVCHHAMLRDPTGKRIGWTYCFGDYWGPYTFGDLPGGKGAQFMGTNYAVIQPLGWIYRYTGRRDYLAVLADAIASLQRPSLLVPAAHAAVGHARADRIPPAAITDLTAALLPDGKVRLTWTAPGDDGSEGRAAWYQVKCSAARIVERVKGWPDRTPPLPTNRKEWEARAASYNARQRAFWAANNIGGAPKPAVAGARETMVAEGLPATGRAYLAVKTWDEAGNVSELSNVATVVRE